MILSFNPRFVEPILKGQKTHTIRLDPNCRWKEKRKIQFATGVRTKSYKCFIEGSCYMVRTIEICWHELNGTFEKVINSYVIKDRFVNVFIDGVQLDKFDIDQLAYNDGFDSTDEFFKWFSKEFKGRIIYWCLE